MGCHLSVIILKSARKPNPKADFLVSSKGGILFRKFFFDMIGGELGPAGLMYALLKYREKEAREADDGHLAVHQKAQPSSSRSSLIFRSFRSSLSYVMPIADDGWNMS
jgi:hypothetical protein